MCSGISTGVAEVYTSRNLDSEYGNSNQLPRERIRMRAQFASFVFSISAISLCMWMPHSMQAQVAGATLSGTITDQQGGAIPNANVSAQNTGTGVATSTLTNSAGAYTLPNLIPGDYELTISVSGFATV